jgi:UDP-glucuronate 4-epimerase
MAYYSFTDKILRGDAIEVFNHGDMMRDFTYIDDIVESIVRLIDHKPAAQKKEGISSYAPYALYNIGNNNPEHLMDFIAILENALGRKAVIEMKPMQAGDVQSTFADTRLLSAAIGFKPSTPLAMGIGKFVDWYKLYNGLSEAA